MFGGNLPDNDEFTTSLITNEEVIRVNQHSTNNREISFKEGVSIWSADDKENKAKYIAILNVSDKAVEVTSTAEELGVTNQSTVRDLWKKTDLRQVGKGLAVSIPAHGAILYSIKK